MADKKILIAYYSNSGNTKRLAEKIQSLVDADIFEIKSVNQYPKNYTDLVNYAKKEKEENYKPELVEQCDISQYETIYLGTPVWWYTFASPIRTFLSDNDFSGKVIKPFCTHGGGGAYTTYTDIKGLCPDAQVKEGFTVYENSASDSDIQKWVNE